MGRIAKWGALVVAVGAALVAILAYQQLTALEISQVGDDLYVLQGFGGNVAVLRTERGSIVVDTLTFRVQGERVLSQAESLIEGPVIRVINTHYHLDHTHGNVAFPVGTEIVATSRTRELLLSQDGDYWEGDNEAFLPTLTFKERHELFVGGKTVRVLFLGRGHTGGDAVVHFVDERAVHLGDLFFHRHYPNIDLEAGGTVRGWVETLDRVLEIDFDHAIPGHGDVGTREDVVAFQGFLRAVWTLAERAAAEGWDLAETQRNAEGLGDGDYQTLGVPGFFYLDRDFAVRRAWEEATGAVAGSQPLE